MKWRKVLLGLCLWSFSVANAQTLRLHIYQHKEWLEGLGYSAPLNVSVADWQKIQKQWITYAENNGYPFASLRLDSLAGDSVLISATITFSPNLYIAFDTIQVAGNVPINTKFLANYLRILKDEPFSQKRVNEIEAKINQLPYAHLAQQPAVIFKDGKAVVSLHLQKQNANQTDGVVGFLPNEEASNKLTLTGQFNLKINNLFKRGKSLTADWQRIRKATQQMNILYTNPLGWKRAPLEWQFGLNLLKEDTSFLNRNIEFSIKYALTSSQKIGFLVKSVRSFAQAPTNANTAVPVGATNYWAYGLQYEWAFLDDFNYPHKGWRVQTEATAGNKTYRRYAVEANSFQVSGKLLGEFYTHFYRKNVLLFRLKMSYLDANILYINELSRVGGLLSLRGFNENRFYASTYGVFTSEYRYFWEEKSYLFAFYEQGALSYKVVDGQWSANPWGVGTGICFTTQGGLFSLTYALGNSADQPLSFNNAKIHFGYVARF
ncbi:Outer membrane translocation and assembly module TamA [Flexibacter flexilis DSM 6793]|uniref:Outer membrane translocation and assembly module TamA n=1 Tax=Flexibacter flexilis DSM 6793 TaxID=927664 RepID=A0A1I1JU32_9BACT|nr:hypothetical protein [Flexibacter flexilis]SFC51751.1 Outer membrane translocation and assembly module TamA [Flexibacter flexilis DSM 6793]